MNQQLPAAAIAAATAAVTTAITAATAAAATAAESAFTRRRGTGFIDGQGASFDFLAVELADRLLSFFFRRHFYKSETFAASREFVDDDLSGINRARFAEELTKAFVCDGKR